MEKHESIDLSDEEKRRSYLLNKFNDLFVGVNTLYGRELTELLVTRLERTIANFHQDVQRLLAEIKNRQTHSETAAETLSLSSRSSLDEDEWSKHLF